MSENKKRSSSKTAYKRKPDSKDIKREKNREKSLFSPDSSFHHVFPYVLGAFAIFLLFCFFSDGLTGIIGRLLRSVLYGISGKAAFSVPLLLTVLAIFWKKNASEEKLGSIVAYQAVFFVFLSVMLHVWNNGSFSEFSITEFWKDGKELIGGGFFGGLFGYTFYKLTGYVGTYIIGITALILTGLFMFGLTPYMIYIRIAYRISENKRIKSEREAGERNFVSKKKPAPEEEEKYYSRVKRDPVDRHRFEPDLDVGEGYPDTDTGVDTDRLENSTDDFAIPFDLADGSKEKVKPLNPKIIKKKDPMEIGENEGKTDLEGIFNDSDGLDVLRRFADEQRAKAMQKKEELLNGEEAELEISRASAMGDESEETVKREYVYPPITLLKKDISPKNEDISEELHTNAVKLVETLRSFKVRTRIVNVSRGPAITRYELAPEEGVRVRSIANLVDDIALSLATTGVRIEAPIPGKAAVGIEVPNKSVSTVFLRELVDTEIFKKAVSKLNVSLGIDVAGNPIFLDIAKMPHLLIAGATGMGKSVCINSIITSLLYKASSDDVKLILIDPKKVELNVYNGLPHLLVPVVSDPKKAAGSLHWAVTEMERRFELIEDVGVRDVKNYNIVTKDDPDKEFLPHIVIIIDELADLMMTAPDDVEASICRLAQKARAAGMHLIIGTQRPSVDVITGLIKANVPSRIAFTVASQTDSRVVLDMSGAEKLIGRGDMLYAPVGASKPIRVQGAFVSEKEVENIVSFIKENNGVKAEYSTEIIESIDRAAAACGNKKGGPSLESGFDGDEMGDSMLRPAIELAIESGKISTSLIQRRLSLGYGRAAKLIDEMEKRGFVSAPEGQKPRSVLITKQQYMEMVVNRGEELE